MTVVIVGPGNNDPSFLQDQIDTLNDEVAAIQGNFAYSKVVSSPAQLVQILHELTWVPAGVLCVDNGGSITEPDSVTNPQSGVTEVHFGVPFTGTVYLS